MIHGGVGGRYIIIGLAGRRSLICGVVVVGHNESLWVC